MPLAVVMNAGDRLSDGELTGVDGTPCTTVGQLVLTTRHAAARSVQLI